MTQRSRTTIALVGYVTASGAVAVGGLALTRVLVPTSLLTASNDVVGNYLQTVGTIYAVLMAFVVYVVWTQFNDACGHVEREANELRDLFRISGGLPAPIGPRVAAELRRYADAVLDEEWGALARNQEATIWRVGHILEDTWAALTTCAPTNECERMLHGEALARFNDLSDARALRLASSRLRIPTALKVLLYSGGAITVASMYLFAMERFAVHATITAALAGAIAHVLYIVADLDDCYRGDFQVPRAPFERARDHMTAATKKEPTSLSAMV